MAHQPIGTAGMAKPQADGLRAKGQAAFRQPHGSGRSTAHQPIGAAGMAKP